MNKLNLKGTWCFLKEHKKILIGTFIISGIVAAGISLLLPNYYKSNVLLLSSAVNASSKAILNESDCLDPFLYGTEKESEYILEMLSSYQIIGKACTKFNLKEHYGIKGDGLLAKDQMERELANNINVKRSNYLGVKLIVWDKDPYYAANIANYMVDQLEILRNEIKQAKADSISMSLKRSTEKIKCEIDVLTDSLSRLNQQYKIYAPESYSDRFSQELAKQVASGNNAGVNRLEAKMQVLSEIGPKMTNLREQLVNKRSSLKFWEDQYEKALVDLNSQIPADFIIERAMPSATKDKPKRSMIVLIAALCCTIIATETLVIKEKYLSSDSEDENKRS